VEISIGTACQNPDFTVPIRRATSSVGQNRTNVRSTAVFFVRHSTHGALALADMGSPVRHPEREERPPVWITGIFDLGFTAVRPV
jgi:hypothetical protein